jgi:hypothetical protein
MLTYTGMINLYSNLINNSSSAALALGNTFINEAIRRIASSHNWPFLSKIKTDTTVASQQFYNLPADYKKLNNVSITIGTTIYVPKECPTREAWNLLNEITSTSDIPEWYYIQGKQIGFWPIPASTGNTITEDYKLRINDLSVADYSTGTIVSITKGATAVVGSSTVWNASMIGKFIKIVEGGTTNLGDAEWYEISAVGSNTTLTLTLPYLGTTIAAGSATYLIGEISFMPEEYHILPIYEAVHNYWAKEGEMNRANEYESKFTGGLKEMKKEYGEKTTNPTIEDVSMIKLKNPNLYISF